MRKLIVFNQVTLDGYFCDTSGDMSGDMSWAHKSPQDVEWNNFTSENASSGGVLIFGRITYDLMANFWPTPQAMQMAPAVAEGMNRMQKVVFSRSMDQPAWQNTRLVKAGLVGEIQRMKSEAGPGMVILGSGSLVSQLAAENLIDEYQIIVNPIAIGQGRTLFNDIPRRLALKLTKSRTFGNGSVLLCYEPAA